MPIGEYVVAQSNHDAVEASNAAVSITACTMQADATTEYIGFLFQAVTFPAGATLNTACLIFHIESGAQDEPEHPIYLQDSSSPAVFTTGASDISLRPRTSASYEWVNANLGATGSTLHDPGDTVLNAMFNELFGRYDYSAGLNLVAIVRGGSSATRDLGILAVDTAAASPAKLRIDYTEAGGGNGTPPPGRLQPMGIIF